MNEEKYIKGFNNGYVLAEHKPELLKTVTQNLPPVNEYVEGILDGKEQRENEKIHEQMQFIGNLRDQAFNRDKEQEM